MNIAKIDLNLLVYLDVLLREGSVTKAANQLSITQPAMSNGLKRLRDLFKDPLLVRTSEVMILKVRVDVSGLNSVSGWIDDSSLLNTSRIVG